MPPGLSRSSTSYRSKRKRFAEEEVVIFISSDDESDHLVNESDESASPMEGRPLGLCSTVMIKEDVSGQLDESSSPSDLSEHPVIGPVMADVSTQTAAYLSEEEDEYVRRKYRKTEKRGSPKSPRKKNKKDVIEISPMVDGFLLTPISDDPLVQYIRNTPLLYDRLGLKALYTNDINLLRDLAPTDEKESQIVKPTTILRSASFNRPHQNVLVDSILLNRVDFIEEIISQETPKRRKNGDSVLLPRPNFPEAKLLVHDAGSVGYRAYGAHVNKFAIGAGRGGREGNRAFAKDVTAIYDTAGPRLNASNLNSIFVSLLLRKVSLSQLKGFMEALNRSEFNERAEFQLSTNLGLAARLGRDDLLQWMLGVALRVGGIGLSPLHLQVLSFGCEEDVRDEIKELISKLADESDNNGNEPVSDETSPEADLLKRYRKVSWTKKATGNFQISPLHIAAICSSINTTIFQSMLEGLGDRAITDCVDEHGWTVLHYAAVNHSTHLLRFLLEEKKAQVNVFDGRGHTPIMVAAFCGNIEAVKLLMAANAEMVKTGRLAGRRIGKMRNTSNSPFCSSDPFAKLSGLDIYEIAIKGGSVEVLEELMRASSKPSKVINKSRKEGCTLMHRAAEEGKPELLKLLIKMKGDVKKGHKRYKTPLSCASMNGFVEEMAMLIEAGADVNDVDSSGNTALHYSCAYGSLHATVLLIECGADVNQLNSWKMSPASIALQKCHYGLVEWLIDNASVDSNVEGEAGMTLLHVFCKQIGMPRTLDMIRRLIKIGARVDSVALQGKRATHFLAETRIPMLPVKQVDTTHGLSTDPSPVSQIPHSEQQIGEDQDNELSRCSDKNPTDVDMESSGRQNREDDSLSNAPFDILAPQEQRLANEVEKSASLYEKVKEEREQLMDAVVGAFRILIKNGAYLNARDSSGRTPLQIALENRNGPLVGLLLNEGVNLHIRNEKGYNLLHTVCEDVLYEECETILEALENSVDKSQLRKMADAPDHLGNTPLILATKAYCKDRAKNIACTPASFAAPTVVMEQRQKLREVRDRFFSAMKKFIRSTGVAPLQQTQPFPLDDVQEETANSFETFNDPWCSPKSTESDIGSDCSFGAAAKTRTAKQKTKEREKLEQKVTEDRLIAREDDAIHPMILQAISTEWKSIPEVAPKTDHEVLPAMRLREPNRLRYQWREGRWTAVHFLVHHKLSEDLKAWETIGSDCLELPLPDHESSEQKSLQEKSASDSVCLPPLIAPNLQDIHGVTPLMLAVKENQRGDSVEARLQMTFFLASPFCSPNVINAQKYDGATALLMAACMGLTCTVKLLLEAGADHSISDMYGRTVAHACCFRRDAKLLDVLIKYEVDLEKTDNYGRTPLHYALSETPGVSFDFEMTVLQYITKGRGEDPESMQRSPTIAKLLSSKDCNGLTLLHCTFMGLKNGTNRIVIELPANMFVWSVIEKSTDEKDETLDAQTNEQDQHFSVILSMLDMGRGGFLSKMVKGAVPTSIDGNDLLIVGKNAEVFKRSWEKYTGKVMRLATDRKEATPKRARRKAKLCIKIEETSSTVECMGASSDEINVEEVNGRLVQVEFAIPPIGVPFPAKDPIEVVTNICSFADVPIHSQNKYGISCLAAAACAGSTISALALLQRGCGLEIIDNDGNTVLAQALQNNHFDLAVTLITKSASVDCAIKYWQSGTGVLKVSTPYYHCIKNQQHGVAFLLLQESFPFFKAVVDSLRVNELSLLLTLLGKVTDQRVIQKSIPGCGGTILHILCSGTQQISDPVGSRLIKILISLGVDPFSTDNAGRLAIHLAAAMSQIDLIKSLLSIPQAVPMTRQTQNLGWLPVCEIFFAQSPDRITLKQATSTLITAIKLLAPRKPNVQVLEFDSDLIDSHLMSQRFAIPQRSKSILGEVWGLPAVSGAQLSGGKNHFIRGDEKSFFDSDAHDEMISNLLASCESTFLIEAVKCGKGTAEFLVLEFLETFRLDPSLTDSFGMTPLFWAIKQNFQELALQLMTPGFVWWEGKDVFGLTALHHALQPLVWGTYDNASVVDGLLKLNPGTPSEDELKEAKGIIDSINFQIPENVKSILLARYPTLSQCLHSPNDLGVPQLPTRPDFIHDAKALMTQNTTNSQPTIKPPAAHSCVKSAGLDANVVIDDDDIYDALLVKVDVSVGEWGENNFYHMQLLYEGRKDLYVVLTRWGRVGDSGMRQLTPADDLETGKKDFAKIFKSKTGVEWQQRDNAPRIPKKYFMLPFNYRSVKYQDLADFNFETLLPFNGSVHVAELLKHITDAAVYHEAVRALNVDLERIPLNRLGPDILKKAEELLDAVSDQIEVVDRAKQKKDAHNTEIQSAKEKLLKLSSEYYTIIPNMDSANEAIRPFSSRRETQNEKKKIRDLRDFELSINIIMGASYRRDSIHPFTYSLNCLQISLESLPIERPERRLISRYFQKTCVSCHPAINRIFRVHRAEETSQFNLSNRRLLWHGTSTCNLMGIFYAGFRVAPMTAKFTGAAFGEGIYFSDMAAKSLNYTTREEGSSRYLFLCEVAVGTTKLVFRDEAFASDVWESGIDTLQVCGRRQPDWNKAAITPYGISFPILDPMHIDSPPIRSNGHSQQLMEFNEFVVKSPSQVKLRYLIEINEFE